MEDMVIRRVETGALQANAYLLYRSSRDDCLLIDPGDDLDGLEAAIGYSQRRLTDILLTHGHFDHILAAAELSKRHSARIHAHPYDAHMLLEASASLYNPAWCRLPFTPVDVDEPYPAGDGEWSVEACGLRFVGFRTPGHTPGSVCLLHRESRSLFTGDTLFACGYGRTDFPGGSDDEMAASLNRLLGMQGDLTAYPGHGEADRLGDIARRQRR